MPLREQYEVGNSDCSLGRYVGTEDILANNPMLVLSIAQFIFFSLFILYATVPLQWDNEIFILD